jgi:isopenicillin N synthase-like dioxygenase
MADANTVTNTSNNTSTCHEDKCVPQMQELVILDWDDLISSSSQSQTAAATATATATVTTIAAALEKAFGQGGLGIVAIRNVPGFCRAKKAFLPMAHSLATLPTEYLEANLTDKQSLYNAGWSHGKEKLSGNKPDTAKGSFYYNPMADCPGTAEDRATYPLSYPTNKWPDEQMLPGFRNAAIALATILFQAVLVVAQHIDALVYARNPHYDPPNLLYQAMRNTDKVKARLLYYFPLQQHDPPPHKPLLPDSTTTLDDDDDDDTWIGWHNDSGFLTALAGDLYVHHVTGEELEMVDTTTGCGTDDDRRRPGLYVATRRDVTTVLQRVTIPADCMAVQLGECTQIVTGGVLCATPHCVRGVSSSSSTTTTTTESTLAKNIARISLPCFVDAPPAFPLRVPVAAGTTQQQQRQQVLDASVPHDSVPPLGQRWTENGMAFGDFLHQTFSLYYNWNTTTTTTT